ncbi:uncharacterized protein MONOS_984 [Monocercomonoides exilis]|uniref:uncharacterized protein n=1 Tax=Monocercomonoides exilis TaxID=2049356 RepID=UPI00355A8F4B|nr:hypothetical protein MONOS_984 [Monocercomonoides exilis]|eukprot:MONOS_984.1-p1 / transcript=MONOS_984.1 / gene=MONOS_984 / organism=Monocercomonoides_exilis_PA203 / gene_product=unspecified product / transcript_product=unspecified product / location=Mono_scaffold00016:150131-151183(-) / protein_length=351 / sequence_SO=supercontig / SO=protein_coding / is_pseudo=false
MSRTFVTGTTSPEFYPSHIPMVNKSSTDRLAQQITSLESSFAEPTFQSTKLRSNALQTQENQAKSGLNISREYSSLLENVDQTLCSFLDNQILNVKSIEQLLNEGIPQELPFSIGPYDKMADALCVIGEESKLESSDFSQLFEDENLGSQNESRESCKSETDGTRKAQKKTSQESKTHFTSIGTIDEQGLSIPVFALSVDELLETAMKDESGEENAPKIESEFETGKDSFSETLEEENNSSKDSKKQKVSPITHLIIRHNREKVERGKINHRKISCLKEEEKRKVDNKEKSDTKLKQSIPSSSFFSPLYHSSPQSYEHLMAVWTRLQSPLDSYLTLLEDVEDQEKKVFKQ